MTDTFTTKDDGLNWIADRLGSGGSWQDAELIWQYGRDNGQIVHNGRDFEISPDFDLFAALETADTVPTVDDVMADAATANGFYEWDDEGGRVTIPPEGAAALRQALEDAYDRFMPAWPSTVVLPSELLAMVAA